MLRLFFMFTMVLMLGHLSFANPISAQLGCYGTLQIGVPNKVVLNMSTKSFFTALAPYADAETAAIYSRYHNKCVNDMRITAPVNVEVVAKMTPDRKALIENLRLKSAF